ncbi:Monothiol glutaredoxin-s3 [Thalictrum thalictroides]|uniref:Monothiol glutaredoxin-s3 n=1 Tax=Thalictrum thalictroides TaxID=46969 RepID=A0A7J6X3H9_THATH|nr:Monothiol glutaredoxin-s3 [Thalictrum thalictroides]
MERAMFLPPSDFGVARLATQSSVVIFSKTTCCMSYSIKTLFNELRVNPVVHELDQDPKGKEMERVLLRHGCKPSVPAVFIGGALIGGANEVMSLHLTNSLIPLLRRAGAL